VHYLAQQPLNHLLADDAILLARQFCDRLRDRVDHFVGFTGSGQKRDLGDPSLALSDGCNGLRTRSLKLASRVKRRKRRNGFRQ
jgi:hypothetical protein